MDGSRHCYALRKQNGNKKESVKISWIFHWFEQVTSKTHSKRLENLKDLFSKIASLMETITEDVVKHLKLTI